MPDDPLQAILAILSQMAGKTLRAGEHVFQLFFYDLTQDPQLLASIPALQKITFDLQGSFPSSPLVHQALDGLQRSTRTEKGNPTYKPLTINPGIQLGVNVLNAGLSEAAIKALQDKIEDFTRDLERV